MYDGQGIVTLGNVLHSINGVENTSLLEVKMEVKGIHQSCNYILARVCYKEQFLKKPEFWTVENRLYWNHGGQFIGKSNRSFVLKLCGDGDTATEFELEENTEFVVMPEGMPIGNYHYEVCIIVGSIFKKVKEVIAEGNCVIGDQNLLRFMNRRIVVDSITDGFNEGVGRITIKPCYIDQIQFLGVQDTSEGYCPVYNGVMYTTGYHGERYNFSTEYHTNKYGITKMKFNNVRIVYISDAVLCITDSDSDGLYYYHYYDKDLECTVYALTDREYTKKNKHIYSTADLYSYWTERI
jgi:hypothetical protein